MKEIVNPKSALEPTTPKIAVGMEELGHFVLFSSQFFAK